MDEDIKNRKTVSSAAILPAFGEKSPVNFGPLATNLGCYFRHTKVDFFGRSYFYAR